MRRGVVRLTVTHEGLRPDDAEGAGHSWPVVLASLEPFLETARPLSSLLVAARQAGSPACSVVMKFCPGWAPR